MTNPARTIYRFMPWLVGILFLTLYAATAAPSIVALFDDSLEFQLVLPTFGIAHPTGYPLYTLLGGIWSRLLFPFGNWAWRVNLFSALAATATVVFVFVLARRMAGSASSGRAAWAGLAAVAVFSFGPVWWSQATVGEVYALHNLLVAAILVVAVGIDGENGAFDRRMALLSLLLGLGLAHHRTVVLLLPGLVLYLLWSVPGLWRPRRAWWLWLILLVAPLLLYAFIPLRAAMGIRDLNGSYANTLPGFVAHIMAQGYVGFFSGSALAADRSTFDWLQLWVAQAGWFGLLLAVVGLGWLFLPRLRWFKAWVLIAVVLLTNLLFAFFYQVVDQEVFLLPALLCAAVFSGGGLALLLRRLPDGWTVAAVGLIVLLLLAAGPGRGPWVNRANAWQVHDYAVDMAKIAYPADSHVVGIEGEITALKYMQQAERLAPNATGVIANDPEARRTAIAASVEAGIPTYITREVAGIADLYSFSGVGPLVRVWPRGEAQTGPPATALQESLLDGRLQLLGYDLEFLDWAGGPHVRLALYLQLTELLTQTLQISLRVVDDAGQPLTYPDGVPAVIDRLPLRQVAPTTAWLPGEIVRDVQEIVLPPQATESGTHLLVILYDADTLAEAGRLELELPSAE